VIFLPVIVLLILLMAFRPLSQKERDEYEASDTHRIGR
jgi:hypothetical protein